jgi:NAD(P)-dependent dehydrogenase (short-subunit alcohol dehydrogenase family)
MGWLAVEKTACSGDDDSKEAAHMAHAGSDVRRKEEVGLVTGSRRGLGLGAALALSEDGFNVVLNGVAPASEAEDAIRRVRSGGGQGEYIQADLSKREDREALISAIKERFGRLDILVNNAGVAPQPREDILVATEESFDRLINTNLKGPYFLTQRIATWMIEQKQQNPQRNPKIINITSINSFTASPTRGDYCLSKAGLSMMTALFSIRLAQYGIRVYEVQPGIMKTDMTIPVREKYNRLIAGGLLPINRWGTPEDVGKAVLALVKDYLPYSTGEVIHVDGGFHLRTL